MKLVDLSILIYAVNRDSPHHETLRAWWENAVVGAEPIGLAWVVILGFLRLSTNPKVFNTPLSPDDAVALVAEWLELPIVEIVSESAEHWQQLSQLVRAQAIASARVTDAHLATLAITHNAKLISCDADFGRFPGLIWENPLVDLAGSPSV